MKATIHYIGKQLGGIYHAGEIEGFTRLIVEKVCGWDFSTQVVNKNEVLADSDFIKIKEIVSRLKNFEPIQYILEETEFYGMRLKVTPSVLIPRPETEELAHWIINNFRGKKVSILDIGAGSGNIALALKNHLKDAEVTGADISGNALALARENAIINGLDVNFLETDILEWEKHNWPCYNVIVSNPPYVRESEKINMHANVLKYEPGNALFVPDADPLKFYRAIALFAKKHLYSGGSLFFEINENLDLEMKILLDECGFCEIKIRNDINGKKRMVNCMKCN